MQPLFDRLQQPQSLLDILGVYHNIVGVPLKFNIRVVLLYPFVKHDISQKSLHFAYAPLKDSDLFE